MLTKVSPRFRCRDDDEEEEEGRKAGARQERGHRTLCCHFQPDRRRTIRRERFLRTPPLPPDLGDLNHGELIFGVEVLSVGRGCRVGVTKSHALARLARNCPIFILKKLYLDFVKTTL